MRPIAEYEGVDHARFRDEIRPRGEPAVLRGLAADWPAVTLGSDEALADYLKTMAGPRPVSVLIGPPEIKGRFFYKPGYTELNFIRGNSPLGAFLDRLLADRGNQRPHAAAIQSEPVGDLLPGFRETNDIDLVAPDVIPRAWIGNRVRVAPHYDLKENIGVVVAGRRRFTLFPPEQIANLYPGPFELTPAGTPVSLVDPTAPDLERFPRYAAALETAQTATLAPGDAIYIPYHWWHGVESLEPVNMLVNYWWSEARPGLGNPYDALLYALYALHHLPDEQRAVWRMLFDHYVFGDEAAAHLPEPARGVLGDPTSDQLERMRAMLKQILGRL
jgi:hypothetical protein